MSGHVFHPGHGELHGVTVVARTVDGRCLVGRYHEETPRGILLHDVAVFDPAAGGAVEGAWLRRQWTHGVQAAHRNLVVPAASVQSLERFSEPPVV